MVNPEGYRLFSCSGVTPLGIFRSLQTFKGGQGLETTKALLDL